MGIPAYFSHIVKKYPEIFLKHNKNVEVDNFFLDSNSIIYDCVNELLKKKDLKYENFENILIKNVCFKIEEYIKLILPNELVYIAFDGVAPIAKLHQQRTRRFRNILEKKLVDSFSKKKSSQFEWNRSAITPGTNFMNNLGINIKKYFLENKKYYSVKKIIISTPDEEGEGEHKIFSFMRNNSKIKREINYIYGLDADLIVLNLVHLKIINKLFLFRESPEFISSLNSSLKSSELYIMDVYKLAFYIEQSMTNNQNQKTKIISNFDIINDYVFLSFLLGNDFLPHFPTLNIRTNGISNLLSSYKISLGNKKKLIINSNKIRWSHFRILLNHLCKNEESWIKNEYEIRDKMSKKHIPNITEENKKERLNFLPILDRKLEKIINPFEKDWEKRYYKILLDFDPNEQNIKNLCINYLEGLEWNYEYYISGCRDWNWHYKYNYPPLLKDLITYTPYFDTTFLNLKTNGINNSVHPLVQLSYVLPKESLDLIPEKLKNKLVNDKKEWYNSNFKLHTSFCKYFWESHIDLPEINILELKNIVNNYLIST